MRIAIINAGMSEHSSTAQLGRRIQDSLTVITDDLGIDVSIEWVDLRPLTHAIADNVTTGFPNAALSTALATVSQADALVALTPVYQASYSGVFKSFVDVIDDGAIAGTPVLMGATGGSPRHALVTESAMRPLFIYMHANPISTAIYAATEDWGAQAADSGGEEGTRLLARIERAARQLIEAAHPLGALANHTPVLDEPGEPSSSSSMTQEYPGFVDFGTLLARGGVR